MKCRQPIRINKDTPEEQMVPCGYCWPCKDNRYKEWTFRLKEEQKQSKNSWFITLTYSDDTIPIITRHGEILKGVHNKGSPSLYMPDLSDFMKALRQKQDRDYTKYKKLGKPIEKWKIRFYGVGEYGTQTMRPHYHVIVFNLYESVDILDVWKRGHVTREPLTEGRIKYVSGYILDKDQYPKGSLRPSTRMSQGIGRSYLERAKSFHLDNELLYSPTEGKKQRLPRYYIDRMFTGEHEKLERARDKQKQYVLKNEKEPDHKAELDQKNQNDYSIKKRKRKNKL